MNKQKLIELFIDNNDSLDIGSKILIHFFNWKKEPNSILTWITTHDYVYLIYIFCLLVFFFLLFWPEIFFILSGWMTHLHYHMIPSSKIELMQLLSYIWRYPMPIEYVNKNYNILKLIFFPIIIYLFLILENKKCIASKLQWREVTF